MQSTRWFRGKEGQEERKFHMGIQNEKSKVSGKLERNL